MNYFAYTPIVLCILCPIQKGYLSFEWSYDVNSPIGPPKWGTLSDNYCDGIHQSPINLKKNEAILDPRLGFISFIGPEWFPGPTTMENNGHSVKITIENHLLAFKDRALPYPYNIVQIHFHWGSINEQGSEHTVDGKRYPLEMHVVGIKSIYSNLSEAIKYPDGLAVLGVFYKIGEYNPGIRDITEHLREIPHRGDITKLLFPSITKLLDLFPNNIHDYYRYRGSLTIPDCNEVIIWTVFADSVYMSQEQINAFRSLKSTKRDSSHQEYLRLPSSPNDLMNDPEFNAILYAIWAMDPSASHYYIMQTAQSIYKNGKRINCVGGSTINLHQESYPVKKRFKTASGHPMELLCQPIATSGASNLWGEDYQNYYGIECNKMVPEDGSLEILTTKSKNSCPYTNLLENFRRDNKGRGEKFRKGEAEVGGPMVESDKKAAYGDNQVGYEEVSDMIRSLKSWVIDIESAITNIEHVSRDGDCHPIKL